MSNLSLEDPRLLVWDVVGPHLRPTLAEGRSGGFGVVAPGAVPVQVVVDLASALATPTPAEATESTANSEDSASSASVSSQGLDCQVVQRFRAWR